MSFGKRVRKRRLALGLTQAELGRRARLTKQSVSQIETERFQPSLDTAGRVARALDCPIASLLDERQPTRAAG